MPTSYLMQCHSSYVVTDPKGSLLIECGHLLEKKKYQIRFFNTINFKKSLHYNPFHYIHSEKDILKLARKSFSAKFAPAMYGFCSEALQKWAQEQIARIV